jgi:NAD(P)-dependent dehydrogenase (short-subunit alcohol dehydrogenase family)
MNLQLDGKTALVTGSTAGIGLGIARALAAEGARVIINGRGQARVDAALAQLRAAQPGARLVGFAADLGRADESARLITAHPDLDILVNNLGVYGQKAFEEISDEDWLAIINANFMTGMRLARHHLPRMKSRNSGRILFIASESGVDVPSEMIHYGVTKTMQIALARGLAKLCAGTAVTVNSVLPGPTRSEGVEAMIERLSKARGVDAAAIEKDFFVTRRPNSLLRRFASVDEVAAMCAYLASPLSAATNGAALRCEGGIVNSIV